MMMNNKIYKSVIVIIIVQILLSIVIHPFSDFHAGLPSNDSSYYIGLLALILFFGQFILGGFYFIWYFYTKKLFKEWAFFKLAFCALLIIHILNYLYFPNELIDGLKLTCNSIIDVTSVATTEVACKARKSMSWLIYMLNGWFTPILVMELIILGVKKINFPNSKK